MRSAGGTFQMPVWLKSVNQILLPTRSWLIKGPQLVIVDRISKTGGVDYTRWYRMPCSFFSEIDLLCARLNVGQCGGRSGTKFSDSHSPPPNLIWFNRHSSGVLVKASSGRPTADDDSLVVCDNEESAKLRRREGTCLRPDWLDYGRYYIAVWCLRINSPGKWGVWGWWVERVKQAEHAGFSLCCRQMVGAHKLSDGKTI